MAREEIFQRLASCSDGGECPIQEGCQQFKPAIVGGDIGVDPFSAADRLPAKLIAGADTDHLKQQPQRASIAITKRVNDVELAIVVRQAGNEFFAGQTHEVVFLRNLPKKLVRLRLDAVDVRESRVASTDVDRPKVTGPVIQILKQVEVNRPQGRQGNVVEVRFILIDACLGQLDFSRV